MDGLGQVSKSADNAGLIELSTALARNRLGEIYQELGHLDEAEHNLANALEIAESLLAKHPRNVAVRQSLAVTLWNVGDIHLVRGKTSEAEQSYVHALRVSQSLLESEPSNRGTQRHLAIAYDRLGDVYAGSERFQEAVRVYRRAYTLASTLAEESPDSESKRDLIVTCRKLGHMTLKLGDVPASRKYYQEGLAYASEVVENSPNSAQAQHDLALYLTQIAEFERETGTLNEATKLHQKSYDLLSQLASADPHNQPLQRDHAAACENLGRVYLDRKHPEEARRCFEIAAAIRTELAAQSFATIRDQQALAFNEKQLAITEAATGRSRKSQDRLRNLKQLLLRFATDSKVAGNPAFREWIGKQQQALEVLLSN